MFKIVKIDFNGTMVRDLHIVYGALASVFTAHGVKPPTLEVFRNIPAVPLEWYYKQGLPRSVTDAEIRRLFSAHAAENWKHNGPKLRPGTRALLDECRRRKAKTIIVSALNHDLMTERANRLKLHRHFDEIHGGVNDKAKKFRELLDKHEVHGRKTCYLCDTVGDIRSAKEHEIVTIAFLNGYNTPDVIIAAKPDFVVKSMPAALKIIRRHR